MSFRTFRKIKKSQTTFFRLFEIIIDNMFYFFSLIRYRFNILLSFIFKKIKKKKTVTEDT